MTTSTYPMNKAQLVERRNLAKLAMELAQKQYLELTAIGPSCANCENFIGRRGGGGKCSKWDAEPPDDVKEVGCDEWSHDGIPF